MDLVRRAVGSVWVRALVTAALLGVVALQIDWGKAADRLAEGQWGWFALAVALMVVALGLGAVRWHLLLDAARVVTTWPRTLRAYAIGVFSNNFLPTSFGGDAARAWIVGRSGPSLVRALTSVAVDRLTSIACLVPVGWIALAVHPGAVPGALAVGLVAITLAGATAAAGLLLLTVGGGRGLGRFLPGRTLAWAREARGTMHTYTQDAGLLVRAFALGLGYQALVVTTTWFLSKAIELDLSYSLIAVTVPLVLAITIIPVSIAGFGVREGGFVVLLSKAGVSATDATLISLLSVATLALSSLPGAVAMLLPGHPAYHPPAEQP